MLQKSVPKSCGMQVIFPDNVKENMTRHRSFDIQVIKLCSTRLAHQQR